MAYLSRIESGQRRAGTDLLQTLAARLGVTVEYLAYGEGWEDAGRLELQLDHAELSLAGGEAATALAWPRGARLPGLRASPGRRSARATSKRPRSTRSATRRGSGHAGAAQRRGRRPASGSRSPPRCVASGGRAASSSAPSPALSRRSRRSPADAIATEEGIRLSVTLAAALYMAGRAGEAAEICDRAIAESERLSSPLARASAYWNASIIRSEAGDMAEALVPGQARAAPAREHRAGPRPGPDAHPAQPDHAPQRPAPPRGRQGAARDRGQRARLERGHTPPTARRTSSSVPRPCYIEGDLEEARDLASRRRRASGDRELPLVAVKALTLLGQVAWSSGDREDAQDWYRRAIARSPASAPTARPPRSGSRSERWPPRPDWSPSRPTPSAAPRRRPASPRGFRSSTPRHVPPRTTPTLRPAGRLPVINTPPVSSPRTTPANSPSGRLPSSTPLPRPPRARRPVRAHQPS